MTALIAASNAGRWFRDWFTLLLAGVAAVVSIWNAVTSYRARRQDWQRELRLPRYANFAAEAQRLYMLKRALMDDSTTEDLDNLGQTQHHYETALDEVAIVGPGTVSQAAQIVNHSVAEWFLNDGWDSQSFIDAYPIFRLAMRDFIAAASAAIGTDNKHKERASWSSQRAAYEQWKAVAEKSLVDDPAPPF